MILNATEMKTCLLWIIQPYLDKYQMNMKDISLILHQKFMIDAHIEYASNIMHIQGKCDLLYDNNHFIFKNIEGQVDYSFLSMNLIQLLQQYIHYEPIKIIHNNIYYHIPLPIKKLSIKDEHLHLILHEM